MKTGLRLFVSLLKTEDEIRFQRQEEILGASRDPENKKRFWEQEQKRFWEHEEILKTRRDSGSKREKKRS